MNNLRRVRRARGLTTRQLADKAGVSFRSLGKYENGELNIDGAKLKTLVKLALALDCKITDILTDEELVKDVKKTR